MIRQPSLNPREIALTAVLAAAVTVSTLAFTVTITATQGYFNVGEIMVYASALILGPYLGAVAGGVGSAISDLIVAPVFAPGTLVIKGLEAFLVGYIAGKKPSGFTLTQWRFLSVSLAIIVSIALFAIGDTFYTGTGGLTLATITLEINVPLFFWILLSGILAVTLIILSLRTDPSTGWVALAILIGGAEMVSGYLVFEYFVIGASAAFAEIPFNIGQMLVGLTVGLPLAKSLRAAIPWMANSPLDVKFPA